MGRARRSAGWSRRALVVASGVAEVAGFASFALGARHGIAVAQSSLPSSRRLAAVAAYVPFQERLGRVQLVG
ncbi:MAG TPA: hypothetical protein VLA69_07005 [Gaiellaceae bacterium]|nr:hypothetical protein [Gaiellaceae bacterium]